MEWLTKTFAELSNDELYDLLQLRGRVFVVEQNAAYLDCDGKDKPAHHLLLKNDQGRVVACARLLPPGLTYPEASIGRVVVDPDCRSRGLAHDMLKQAIPICLGLYQTDRIHISAQKHLQGFYSQHGFQPVTGDYLEDGIPHVGMLYVKDLTLAGNLSGAAENCQPAPAVSGPFFQLYYLGHSAWLVKTPCRYLLFDYGSLPARPRHGQLADGVLDLDQLEPLPLFAFASHRHADHYSADLQRQLRHRPDTWFILGLDDPPTAAESAAAPAGTWLAWAHSQLKLSDVVIRATASTDSGVSFLVECPEGVIYHGGDLAVWDDTDFYRKGYRQEIDLLAEWLEDIGRVPDLAFLPVSTSDGFQEEAMLQGLWYAQEKLRPNVTVPMHAQGFEHLYRRFVELAWESGCSSVLLPEKPGDSFQVAVNSPLDR